MIIRATKKLLNTSGIKPVKNVNESDAPLPGEWYAGLVSTGRQGKLLIHFLHSSTKLSILCPGKSLNKALPVFPERLEQLLRRLVEIPVPLSTSNRGKVSIPSQEGLSASFRSV